MCIPSIVHSSLRIQTQYITTSSHKPSFNPQTPKKMSTDHGKPMNDVQYHGKPMTYSVQIHVHITCTWVHRLPDCHSRWGHVHSGRRDGAVCLPSEWPHLGLHPYSAEQRRRLCGLLRPQCAWECSLEVVMVGRDGREGRGWRGGRGGREGGREKRSKGET